MLVHHAEDLDLFAFQCGVHLVQVIHGFVAAGVFNAGLLEDVLYMESEEEGQGEQGQNQQHRQG